MALIVAAAAASTAVSSTTLGVNTTFTAWAKHYNFDLASPSVHDIDAAKQAFEANIQLINAHNRRYERGLETYTMGLNQFSHLTAEQFKTYVHNPYNRTLARNEVVLPTTGIPTAVDWRDHGAVTPVKNQGQCGSCWAFSTTGSTESRVKLAGGKLTPLSEQQLMDCSTAEGDHSCQGGLMDFAFKYIIENGGIDSEEDYPYQMKNEQCDAAKEKHVVARIKSYADVPKSDEAQLIAAISHGPVSVAVEADQAGWQHYASGIFSGPCGKQLDHGVLAVGYTDKYIIVKNSWGASWGMKGYIMMARNTQAPEGICGIAMQPSYPVA